MMGQNWFDSYKAHQPSRALASPELRLGKPREGCRAARARNTSSALSGGEGMPLMWRAVPIVRGRSHPTRLSTRV